MATIIRIMRFASKGKMMILLVAERIISKPNVGISNGCSNIETMLASTLDIAFRICPLIKEIQSDMLELFSKTSHR